MQRKYAWYPLVLSLAVAATSGCARLQTLPIIGSRAKQPDQGMLTSHLSLARLSERHGDMNKASQIYQSVLEKDRTNRTALHRLGVIAARTGQLEKGEQYLTQALRMGPPSAELLNDLGYNLYLQDRLNEAESTLQRALKIDPGHEAARVNMGLVMGGTGRHNESLNEFRKVMSEAEAYANLAYVKAQNGDYAGAQVDYHQALSLDEEMRPAAEALLQLSKIERLRRARNKTNADNLAAASREDAQPTTENQPIASEPRDKSSNLPDFFQVIEPSSRSRSARTNTSRPATTRSLTDEPTAIAANSQSDDVTLDGKKSTGTTYGTGIRFRQNATSFATAQEAPASVQVVNVLPSNTLEISDKPVQTVRHNASFQPAEIIYGGRSSNDPRSTQLTSGGRESAPSQPAVVARHISPATTTASNPLRSSTGQRPQLLDTATDSNAVALAPPLRTTVALNPPENTQSPIAASDNLAAPLNHWQQPTWTPNMGNSVPVDLNGSNPSHAPVAESESSSRF